MKELMHKYKAYMPAAFFLGGFLFDIITLARIDESFQLLQQFTYLVVTGALLITDKIHTLNQNLEQTRFSKIWSFRYEAIHFLLGSLLSAYAIFYFKSASLWNSFIFIGFLSLLLILNELTHFKKLGAIIRFSLFALCSCSYFVYLVPIMWQHIGLFTFIFSLIISAIFYVTLMYFLSRNRDIMNNELLVQVTLPGMAIHVLFFLFYIFSFLPPVPLSIEKIGIYQGIEKVNDTYHLFYDRPWWRFWEKGAQTFEAHPNEKIFCFVSVFAPNFFREKVAMEWWYKLPSGWKKTDSVPMQIVGGRDQGFRGYSVKQNYDEGEWQVKVVTSDQREIGRIYFTVDKKEGPIDEPYTYKVDTY